MYNMFNSFPHGRVCQLLTKGSQQLICSVEEGSVVMTAIRNIIGGPSKWNIILSLFEDTPITFTFEGGETVSMIVDNVHDFRGGEYIQQSGEIVLCHPREDGWLLAGRPSNDQIVKDGLVYQIWIEYDAKSRTGIGVTQSEAEYDDMAEELFLPYVWHDAMGVLQPYKEA